MVTYDLAECTVNKLSAASVLKYAENTKALYRLLCTDEQDSELALAISEHAALAFHCLYQGDAPFFDSPLEAAKALTINQLCDVYESYLDINDNQSEKGHDSDFDKKLSALRKEQ